MKFSLSQIEHEIISLVKGFVNSDQTFYEKSNELWDLILHIFILMIFSLALRHAHVLDRKEHCHENILHQKLDRLKSVRCG